MPAKPAPAPTPTPASSSSSQPLLTFEDWVKLDSPGLVGWVETLGLLPDELADAVDSFESNPDFDGSALASMVDGEDWMMEMQFPDDFGLLREKLVNAIEALRGSDKPKPAAAAAAAAAPVSKPQAPPVLRRRSKSTPPHHQRGNGPYDQQFCAVHALNNVFANEGPRLRSTTHLFTADHLNAIAQRMQRDTSPHALVNPHRWLSLGNFDTAVVNSAVKLLGYRPDTFGEAYSTLDLDSADLPSVAGFIITTISSGALSRAHRYSICEVDGYWWRLDSKKPEPVEYPGTTSVFGHLQHIVDHGGTILRIRRPAPNIYAMGVEDVVDVLRSLGLGEPLPYVKRCRDMRIDGFWLSMCGDNELHDGRPMKKPEEPGHNEMQGLMVQFSPHRKLLLARIEALKEAAKSAAWIGNASETDVRLQPSLSTGSASWSEAQCIDRIRKAFPYFTVGTAYDAARELGGKTFNADVAIAALRKDPSMVRVRAVKSVLIRHHVQHPVAGARPTSIRLRRLKLAVRGSVLLGVLHYLGWLAMAEAMLLRSLSSCLGWVICKNTTNPLHVYVAMKVTTNPLHV